MIVRPKYRGPDLPTTLAVNMTAAASGSNGITVADDDDIDFGTGDFFLHWEGSLPDWTPSAVQTLVIKRMTDGSLRGWSLSVNTTSALRFYLRNFASTTLLDNVLSTSLPTVTDGGSAKVTIVCVRETATVNGSLTFYFNGAQIGSQIAIPAQTVVTVSTAEPLYIAGTSTTRIASNTISCIVGNFAPTASEVLDLCTNGIPASWKWGSQASAVSGSVLNGTSNRAFSTFSSGADNFTGTTLAGDASLNYAGYSIGVSPGQKIRVKGSFSITGTLGSAAFRINIATSLSNSAALSDTITVSGTSGDFDVVLTATVSATGIVNFSLGTSPVTDATITVTNIAINRQGATLALLPNTIPTSGATAWDDSSGNTGGGTLPAAGATKVTIRK